MAELKYATIINSNDNIDHANDLELEESVDVGQIMENIRSRIRSKKLGMGAGDVNDKISCLKYDSDISNVDYMISSHRKLVGPVLVNGRKMINGEVRRYVDPALIKQSGFNRNLVDVIDDLLDRLSVLENFTGLFEKEDIKKQIEVMSAKELSLRSRIEKIEKNAKESAMGSWSEFYDMDVNEKFLQDNLEFHKEFVSLIEEYSKKSAGGRVPKLVEIGLGTATFSIHFSRNAYECVGIDNDPYIIKKSIETNKKLGGYVKFVLIDAFDMDLLKDGYFDVAFSQGTMEHFDNDSLFKILSNQLKVSRYIVFSVPSRHWPDREFGNERKITVDDWKLLLSSAGFNVLHIDYYHDKMQIACVIGPPGKK